MKSKFSLATLILLSGLFAHAQNSDHVPRPVVIDYIDTYKAIAISEMKRTGVPASITLAQGIHETEAGTSVLVRKSNNHFGIKCKAYWTGGKVSHDDDARGECFRSYSNAFESYMDHSDFLRKGQRYASLFELDPTDYEGWANGLRKAGYATNPKYASILIKIINNYHLQDYTLIALGKMKPEDEWLATVKPNISPLLAEEQEVIATANIVVDEPEMVYPEGEFKINETRVVYANAGTSLLAIAEKYDIALKRLIDFNELKKEQDNSLPSGQLIFLQRKRKTGANEFHMVKNGESIYDICQVEAIRLESLLEYNHLANGMQPAVGEKLYLKSIAPARPALLSAKPVVMTMSTVSVSNARTEETFTTHIVKTKETLYAISRKYNVPVEKLKEWNKLAGYDLKKGQELIIYKN
jgi:LysM repeat protein